MVIKVACGVIISPPVTVRGLSKI